MPPHFIGTSDQVRHLSWKGDNWQWWPGKLDNPRTWLQIDAQDWWTDDQGLPSTYYNGLYWIAATAYVDNTYASKWVTASLQLSPSYNWNLAVGGTAVACPVRGWCRCGRRASWPGGLRLSLLARTTALWGT